ncbi:hypothetical protein C7B70_23170 [Chlorogloea sp. CCALA 695]|nr:hypothetical protein C7B70_23170 [Chlorogloea sp. CCALA 695]
MKQLLNIEINEVLQQIKQIQLDITSIETENIVILAEVTAYIQSKMTVNNNYTFQALSIFSY